MRRSVCRQNSASVPSSHWLEIFILTLCPPCFLWRSKSLSHGLFWDLNLSILTIITLCNQSESNNRLRILPLLETWCLANSLILLIYVGLLITAMPRAQPQANCQNKWQHPIIFHSDGHLQSWDPDKPGTNLIETEGYFKESLLNGNISNFMIDIPSGFSLGALLIQTDMFTNSNSTNPKTNLDFLLDLAFKIHTTPKQVFCFLFFFFSQKENCHKSNTVKMGGLTSAFGLKLKV